VFECLAFSGALPQARQVEGDLSVVLDGQQVHRLPDDRVQDRVVAREILAQLAGAEAPCSLARSPPSRSYELYEAFRPAIPPGKKGWGAKGWLDLERLREMAR